ncbi:MAG TPA: Uma2 family endonuclease [Anaerolineae bacterium]|nr:Uma2 family endonuclease [Anaerolineae bacterium]HIQ05029.1 Uma2 family endonuclease [Anaerolineae bacterium]
MIEIEPRIERPPLVLRLPPAIEMTREQFFEFCQLNRDLRIERTAEGDIVIIAPAGGETSARNTKLTSQVARWAEEDGSGSE